MTGGLAVMRSHVHDTVPWDDERGFYQGEDVEWSSRLRAAGFRIHFDRRGKVTHQDPRYTQHGRVMRFRQDLSARERLGRGIEAVGMFREGIAHYRWLTTRATLHAPAATANHTAIRFSLTSAAPALTDHPFGVRVSMNGLEAGVATFAGPQTLTFSMALRHGASTEITLESEASVSGHDVGLSDERPVSVLIHDAELVEG